MSTDAPSTIIDPLGTWAGRNPDKPVIQPRTKTKRTLTDAQKATQAEKRLLNDTRSRELEGELRSAKREVEETLEAIAKKYNKKVPYIRDLFYQKGSKQTPALNLWNAKIHWMANKKREDGLTLGLNDLIPLVRADKWLNSLTDNEEKKLLADLETYRETQEKGARIDNKAASLDVGYTSDVLLKEIENLFERTGAVALVLIAQGDERDTVVPAILDSNNARDFATQELKMTPAQLLHRFERWAEMCSSDPSRLRNNERTMLRNEIKSWLSSSLQMVTGQKDIHIQYVQYDTEIRLRHAVELAGWPAGIKFQKPDAIKGLGDLKILHGALKQGDCKWVKMSDAAVEELRKQLANEGKEGRARRSDAGTKRGPQKRKQKGDSQPTGKKEVKRRKTAVGKQLPPSSKFVESSESGSSSEGDE